MASATAEKEDTREMMSTGFAVFNLHINDAGKKADEEFIRIFGQKKFDQYIAPHHEEGIMSIFDEPPGKYRLVWVCMVTALVNSDPDSKITDEQLEVDDWPGYSLLLHGNEEADELLKHRRLWEVGIGREDNPMTPRIEEHNREVEAR